MGGEVVVGWNKYQRDFGFAAVFDAEDEGFFEPGYGVCQGEEGLVWPLRCGAVDGG